MNLKTTTNAQTKRPLNYEELYQDFVPMFEKLDKILEVNNGEIKGIWAYPGVSIALAYFASQKYNLPLLEEPKLPVGKTLTFFGATSECVDAYAFWKSELGDSMVPVVLYHDAESQSMEHDNVPFLKSSDEILDLPGKKEKKHVTEEHAIERLLEANNLNPEDFEVRPLLKKVKTLIKDILKDPSSEQFEVEDNILPEYAYTYDAFITLSYQLADLLFEKHGESLHACSGIYAPPTGGIIVGVAVQDRLEKKYGIKFPLLREPVEGCLHLDDLIDSGRTFWEDNSKIPNLKTGTLLKKDISRDPVIEEGLRNNIHVLTVPQVWLKFPHEFTNVTNGVDDQLLFLIQCVGFEKTRTNIKKVHTKVFDLILLETKQAKNIG